MEFTPEFKEKTKTDDQKYALAKTFNVSFFTILKWLNLNKSDKLTKLKNIAILSEFTGLSQDQIFVKEST